MEKTRKHHTLREEEYAPDWIIVCIEYLMTGIDDVIISKGPILEEDTLYMIELCREVLEDGSFKTKAPSAEVIIGSGSKVRE